MLIKITDKLIPNTLHPAMRIRLPLLGLFFILLVGAPLHAGTEKKVINIEAAMRAWQERATMTTPFKAWWYPNRHAMEPGDYPVDGFYGEDLLDPQFCAFLVENLFWEVSNGSFIDPSTATSEHPLDLFWDVE